MHASDPGQPRHDNPEAVAWHAAGQQVREVARRIEERVRQVTEDTAEYQPLTDGGTAEYPAAQ